MKLHLLRKYSQFKSTVCLPSTAFPVKIKDKAKHEKELQQVCKFDDLYQWQENAHKEKRSFILHDGPPYANGDLHVGHALNKVLKDITNRYKLLSGYKIDYKPGWDCHGLPIELKALKTQQFTSFTPLEIRREARKFAQMAIQRQKTAFKKWAILADWESETGCYFTYNNSYEALELKYFYEMFEKNLIYRDLKPVYWSPSSKTALAESELEYNQQHKSKSAYVLFPIVSSFFQDKYKTVSVLVWTTQPWTLPANQALCYRPDTLYSIVKISGHFLCLVAADAVSRLSNELGRDCETIDTFGSSQLENIICAHPMDLSKTVSMFSAMHVVTDKGTGIVHTAPAHGVDDFQVAQQYMLSMDSYVDECGCFTAQSGFDLEGKFIFGDGNNTVLEILNRHRTLMHTNDFTHSYPYDWRTKKPIFVTTSRQWFIDTKHLLKSALPCLSNVKFLPESGHESMKSLLKSRPFWCISRQRVWGVPIPVFFHKESKDVLINESSMQHVISLVERDGSDVWFNSSIDQLLPESALKEANYTGSVHDFEAGTDILDIWFDSGISWAAVLKKDYDTFPIMADMYIEGKDQYNGWFQSSLLTSVGLQKRAPYRTVMVHGFCVAEDGQKMSKSLGNVIDPMTIVEGGKNQNEDPAYGADTLRWWVAKSNTMPHVQISKTIIDDAVTSVQKIRLGLRFLLSNLNDFQPNNQPATVPLQPIDQYLMYHLKDFVNQVTVQYDSYKYPSVCRTVLNFVTKLSTSYFATVKDRLYCEEKDGELRRSCQTVLHHTLEALVKCIAPILPHLAEEVMLHHPCAHFSSAYKDGWFDVSRLVSMFDCDVVEAVEVALRFREALFTLISSENPSQPTAYDVDLLLPSSISPIIQKLQPEDSAKKSSLCEILSCATCTLRNSSHFINTLSKEVQIEVDQKITNCVLVATKSCAFRCPRCRKHTSKKVGSLCTRCTSTLSSGWDL